jgi:hypothetical protein
MTPTHPPQRSRLLIWSAPFAVFGLGALVFHLAWSALAFQVLAWTFLGGVTLPALWVLLTLHLRTASPTPVTEVDAPAVDAAQAWDSIWLTVHAIVVSLLALAIGLVPLAVAYPLVSAGTRAIHRQATRYTRALNRAMWPH